VWWVTRANNLAWSPRSVCDLYRRRWDIGVFFKPVKQGLKLSNFLGDSANALRWQVYVLLRYLAHRSGWGHRFTRLFAVARSALCERSPCSNPMGQHPGECGWSERSTTRGCRVLNRRDGSLMGQHRPANTRLRARSGKTRNRPSRKNHSEPPPDQARACVSANLWDDCVLKPIVQESRKPRSLC
jgi:hypothetical protein